MTNAMPTFAVYSHRNFKGYVRAVSIVQARTRAKKLYGRCEVIPASKGAITARFQGEAHHTDYMRPCPTPGFDQRREALIKEHKRKVAGLI